MVERPREQPNGQPGLRLEAVGGPDEDARARARVRARGAGPGAGLPDPFARLIGRIRAGSCPVCRAPGAAEAAYLDWPAGAVGHLDVANRQQAMLCPGHLHDLSCDEHAAAATLARLLAAEVTEESQRFLADIGSASARAPRFTWLPRICPTARTRAGR
ncbi:MAG TPA: hypothetical protein VNG13_08255 [Mycobacteriales bacterium]|nr:hypothetical protein [Mycobacteriales bacterium]